MSVFETERLVMRPWREDDAECLHKYALTMTTRAVFLAGMPERETLYYKITREEWQHD